MEHLVYLPAGDAALTRRSMKCAVRTRYPHMPAGREAVIAEHACLKYSGRVGRMAGAKALSPEAVDLAVRAYVRHAETEYDSLLTRGLACEEARAAVQAKGAAAERTVRATYLRQPLSFPGPIIG